jgi:ubiquinone/menaquinone biosynthesis C-methylase UbiE
MTSTTDIKKIFQDGWNIPVRVQNYVRNTADTEFAVGQCPQAWRNVLAKALATEGRLQVLDVGTGPGIYAGLYSQLGHDCVGLDFSETMLAVARERAARMKYDCAFVFGDAEEPPFPDGAFDVVSCRHILFTLPRPGVAVRQWVRVLKPGGKMIIIGEDIKEQNHGAITRWFQYVKNRWSRRGDKKTLTSGWKASPEYRKALDECPLFKNDARVLRAVMEAAGIEDIRSVATEEIYLARMNDPLVRKRRWSTPSCPFVLVGTKPRDGRL